MKVLIQNSIAGENFSYRKGQVVDMDKEQAELWIEGGNAKHYEGEVTSMSQTETGIFKRPTKRGKNKE